MSGFDAFSLGSLDRRLKVAADVSLGRGSQGDRGRGDLGGVRRPPRIAGVAPSEPVPTDWSSFGDSKCGDRHEPYDIGGLPEGCGLYLSHKTPSDNPRSLVDSVLTMTAYGPVLKKVPRVECKIVTLLRRASDGCSTDAEAADEVRALIAEAALKGTSSVAALLNQQVCNPIYLGRTALIQATIGGLQRSVNVILEQEMDPNLVDNSGKAAIHHATLLEDTAIAEALLDHPDVDWSQTDTETEETVAHIAAAHGHLLLVEKIVASGEVDMDATCLRGTPLMVALRKGHWVVAERLLEAGVSLEGCDSENMTAAMLAVRHGAPKCLRDAIISSADLTAKDVQGYTALHYAARDAPISVLQAVFEKGVVDVEERSNSGMTPFLLACSSVGKIEYLETVGASDSAIETATGLTALHMACMKGYTAGIELFLERGFDANAVTSDGLTPLMLAAMARATSGSSPAAHLELLLSKGAELEAQSSEHLTPLCYAVLSGLSYNVEVLLSNDANFSHRDASGQTPLHLAVKSSHLAVSVQLLSSGSSWDWKDERGKTPADMTHPGLVSEIRKQARVHRLGS